MLGGGGVSHPLQLTTGLVINSFVTTSPTLAGERMLVIPKASIRKNVFCLKQYSIFFTISLSFLTLEDVKNLKKIYS